MSHARLSRHDWNLCQTEFGFPVEKLGLRVKPMHTTIRQYRYLYSLYSVEHVIDNG